jgi:hypothetical protein
MLQHPVERAMFAAAAAGSPRSPVGSGAAWLAGKVEQKAVRTRRGQYALRHLRQTNAALRSSAVAAAATLAGADLALAVGLWGPGVLTGSPLDSLRMALRPSTAIGSDGSGALAPAEAAAARLAAEAAGVAAGAKPWG